MCTFKIPERKFEEIKKCKFYKRHLFRDYHLGTLYGLSKVEGAPLWKRLLSHVYVVFRVKIIPYEGSKLSEDKIQELRDRINKGI